MNYGLIIVSFGLSREQIESIVMPNDIQQLVLLRTDIGLPGQRNEGFKFVPRGSKYVLFIDDDVFLKPTAIKNMVQVMESHDDVDVALPLLINSSGVIDSCGCMVDALGYSDVIMSGRPCTQLQREQTGKLLTVTYGGACMMLRLTHIAYNEFFRPFDSDFYFNFEDVDICLRTWLNGGKVVTVLSSEAIHNRGRTSHLMNSPERLVFLNTRNRFLTLYSALGTFSLIRFVTLAPIFEALKSIVLLRSESRHGVATLKALIWLLSHFGTLVTRRRKVRTKNVADALSGEIILPPNLPRLIRNMKQHYDL